MTLGIGTRIHEASLLRAVRIVIRADSDPVRQALFANLKESHRDDEKWKETLELVDATSLYALTGGDFRERSARGCRGVRSAPVYGRQLLRQRQAHGRRRRAAAVRRCARVGHE